MRDSLRRRVRRVRDRVRHKYDELKERVKEKREEPSYIKLADKIAFTLRYAGRRFSQQQKVKITNRLLTLFLPRFLQM